MEEKNKDLKEDKKIETKKEVKKEDAKFQKVENKGEKKKEIKKEKKQGSKKAPWIPTLVTVIVVLLVATLLTVMIVTSSAPKKSLEALLTNLKAGDFTKAQEYLSGEINNLGLDEESQKLLFDKLNWKVNKVTETDDNNATIEVDITTKDIESIINNYARKVLDAVRGAISGNDSAENVSSQDFKDYFVEQLKNDDIQTTTVNATINTVKEDGKWKIVSDESLENAILPGLEEAISTLES